MRPALSYVPYATYSKEKNGNIITFEKFEEGNLLSDSHNGTESGDKYDDSDDDLTLPPLISEAKTYEISSGDEYDAEPIPMDMLEDICDGSQYHQRIIRREARYKIRDPIKQRQVEWKGALLSTQKMGKGSQKVFKGVVNELSELLTIMGESGSEVSYFIPEPRGFLEVIILSAVISKPWLNATLKDINNLIIN